MQSTKLFYDRSLNMSILAYSDFVEPNFMDEFKIADHQQVEFILQIIVHLNFLMEIDTEKMKALVVPNYFQYNKSEIDLAVIWPTNLEGCFQASSFYEFPFDLPNSILTRIYSKFVHLFEIDYLTSDYLLFQEGCFNILIRYSRETQQLELSVRTVDFTKILCDDCELKELKEFKKSILCLFNEYKIVVECSLFENSIPFNVSNSIYQSYIFLILLLKGYEKILNFPTSSWI